MRSFPFAAILVMGAAMSPIPAFAQLGVLVSGGFAGPYRELLPAFEQSSGLTVTSTQAASQGGGPNTIPALLRKGMVADVVVLAKDGLDALIRDGRIEAGSAVDLAQSRLGLAVRAGAPRPNIASVEGFKQAVLRAKSVNFVSTTAVYMNEKLFPSLGIADAVARKANEDRLADLQKSDVDLVLRPVSELVHLPGFDFVGPVPESIQFTTVFTAAVVSGSRQIDAAKQLIARLSSAEALEVARKHGMEPAPGQ
jgi:molybdate transport system substrate-binding protein